MIFYKKTFPLGKGIHFSSYIKALSEQNFSPYTLLIEEIPGTENYHIEMVFTEAMALWRFGSIFALVSECNIQYSKGAREFTLQASVGSEHLFFAIGSLITALCFLLLMPLIIITRGISGEIILGFLVIMIAVLAPLALTYIHDRNRLERIGSIALELNRK